MILDEEMKMSGAGWIGMSMGLSRRAAIEAAKKIKDSEERESRKMVCEEMTELGDGTPP